MEAEAAALVELTTAGKSEQFWLGRNDARLGIRRLQTPGGPLLVLFGYERYPLGFALKLDEVRRDTNPDSANDASCVSQVQLPVGTQDLDVISADSSPREISMDSPLEFGTFSFYQSGFQRLADNSLLSILRVTSDPGRLLKYSGGTLICGGVILMLCLLALVRRPKPSVASHSVHWERRLVG
jgi:hypothetical protein